MDELRNTLVLVRGAGDLASGVALRLWRCGFSVVMTEIERPLSVRRTVSFSEAVYDGETSVEGVTARRAATAAEAREIMQAGAIPVIVDPTAGEALSLKPQVVVDAVMAKRNIGTSVADAPVVIGLGPGFFAGRDVHLVVETNRGHQLGRVIADGSAEPDTGRPSPVCGWVTERVLRAPVAGTLWGRKAIGDYVRPGETVAFVDQAPVVAEIEGVLRGLARDGLEVTEGTKIGDVDPRGDPASCFTVSDKALAIGGGVLEAMLSRL